jgi:DNA-binding LacI/PurR family transcriptional regulator
LTGPFDDRPAAAADDDPQSDTDPGPTAGAAYVPNTGVPTMEDIAKLAHVSQSTVSRVLSGREWRIPIGERTGARVHAAAEQLGYRPNPIARALRGAPMMLIGAIVREFGDPFFAAAVDALATAATASGYNLVLGHAHGRLGEATRLPAVLEVRHVDAIVLLGDLHDQPQLLADLKASSVPVVATWQGTSPIDFPTVDTDDVAGTTLAMEHLAELGHTRIALASTRLPMNNPQREDVYRQFMRDRLGRVPDQYVQRVPNSIEGGEMALAALTELADVPTAVFATTDLVAMGVLSRAWAQDISVPAELSVVGYDDLYISAHTVPPLTTVRMPTTAIIAGALNMAIELARNPTMQRIPRVTRFPPWLVVRKSTAEITGRSRTRT